jgi:hexosaminidase
MDLSSLLPRPRRASNDPGRWTAGPLALPSPLPEGAPQTAFAACARELAKLDVGAREPQVPIIAVDRSLPVEGYRLVAGTDGVRIAHADDAGLAHALRTLAQWIRIHAGSPKGELPGLAVEDHPDFAERGVMLDVSRDRVPRMDELFELVELLAEWKCNRLQLYMEAAFAYAGFEPAWRGTSPFTADEVRALDAHCTAHGIELVPNQQSFGHLHRFLVHDAWRDMAECPEGVEHPFSAVREPFSLCPSDPRSLEFLGTLYDELLPCFHSRTLNVGLDETFDLGQGRSRTDCDERGKQTVYLEFLRAVHGLLTERDRRMQFWADIVLAEPDCVSRIPGDAIAMAWGYDAAHPFDRELPVLAASGLEFHVCPGTSSWNAVGGRVENARVNLESATRAGLEHGARGVLITDWGDRGHHQPPVVSYFGFAAGLGMSWNASARTESAAWARLVDLHALGDTGFLDAALLDLGRLDDVNDCSAENGSALFYTLAFALEGWPHPRLPGIDKAGARRSAAAARSLADRLRGWAAPTAAASAWRDELEWSAKLLGIGARLAEHRCAHPARELRELDAAASLADELDAAIGRHRELWPRRSRPGGLDRSCAVLQRVVDALRQA